MMETIKLTNKQKEAINDAPIYLYTSDHTNKTFYQSDNEGREYQYLTIKSLINKGLMESISNHRTNYYPEFHLTDKGKEWYEKNKVKK